MPEHPDRNGVKVLAERLRPSAVSRLHPTRNRPRAPASGSSWGTLSKLGAFLPEFKNLVKVEGHLPGHTFVVSRGKQIDLEINASLTTQDPIRFLEIIKNGQVERKIPYDEWVKTGSLGTVSFKETGWFLVRVIADNPKTFRFASTAPYYVQVGNVPNRISRKSAQFFLDWVNERMKRVKLEDPVQRRDVLQYHGRAKKFWEDTLAQANAE